MKKRVIGIQRFIKHEAFSSIFLLICAVIAIIWANSPHSSTYFHILHTEIGLNYNGSNFSMSLLHWINDGLMAIFFFVIGLEIKREIIAGQLSTVKKATLPVVAALGGIIAPILLFSILNYGKAGSEGWGIPMATDIAFSLGILTLLGKRVPIALKVFLTAFAIFDDICAVVVIAFFYSTGLNWEFLGMAFALLALLMMLNKANLYNGGVFLATGILIWYLFLVAGIHPTIAGVLVAFTIPANKKIVMRDFIKSMRSLIVENKTRPSESKFLTKEDINWVDRISSLSGEIVPTCQNLEKNLHGYVSYIIMPLFALGNAGVQFISDGTTETGDFNSLSANIASALVGGKVIGITLFTWIAIKLGIADLPRFVKMKHIFGLSFLGGFGFTMSLFINNLSFTDSTLQDSAKLGILLGSLLAAVFGYIILRMVLTKRE